MFQRDGQTIIKVSARSCRLKFIQCGPDCIAKGCTAKCCDAPTSPTGIRVYVSPAEARALTRIGIRSKGGFIQPEAGCRLCPAKTAGHLCGLWQKPERPFGCIASPFMLNAHGTLIIRNRYKLLPCYDPDNGTEAYRVFRSSLIAILGGPQTVNLTYQLDHGSEDRYYYVDDKIFKRLMGREHALGTVAKG